MLRSSSRSPRAALGVFMTVAVFLACGGERAAEAQAAGSAASGKPSIDECTLLTVEQVSAAVGWKVQKSGRVTTGLGCHYTGPRELSDLAAIIVSSGMAPMSNSREMAEWRRKQVKSGWEADFVIEPIEDLGMPAIQNSLRGAGIWGVEAWVRGRLLTVSTTAGLSAAKALAQAAAARLP